MTLIGCNQGYQVETSFLSPDLSVSLNSVSSITVPGSYPVSGVCSPDGSSITVECGAGASSAVICVNNEFSIPAVTVSTVPVACTATTTDSDGTTLASSPEDTGAVFASASITSIYTGPDATGDWTMPIGLLDVDGTTPLAADGINTVTVTITDITTSGSPILFEGNFLVGDDLAIATPTNVSGSADFTTDIQPYLSGVLADVSSLVFKKREWAEANGYMHELFDPLTPTNLNAIQNNDIELELELRPNEGTPANAILSTMTQFSTDNDHIPAPTTITSYPFVISDTRLIGGPLTYFNSTDYVYAASPCSIGAHRNYNSSEIISITFDNDVQTFNQMGSGTWYSSTGALTNALSTISLQLTASMSFGTDCVHRFATIFYISKFVNAKSGTFIFGDGSGVPTSEYQFGKFRAF